MSQVIVTKDRLKDKRAKSREQERRIDRDQAFQRWRRSDISGRDPVATTVGILFAPIALSWAVLTGLIYVLIEIFGLTFKFVGRILSR